MEYTSIKLPIDVGEKLKQIAKENCRSMSAQIAYMLKHFSSESFEDYYQNNKQYIDKSFDQYTSGKCLKFDSAEDAISFLRDNNANHSH